MSDAALLLAFTNRLTRAEPRIRRALAIDEQSYNPARKSFPGFPPDRPGPRFSVAYF